MVDKESVSNNISCTLLLSKVSTNSEIELNCKQKNTILIYLRAFPLVFFLVTPRSLLTRNSSDFARNFSPHLSLYSLSLILLIVLTSSFVYF